MYQKTSIANKISVTSADSLKARYDNACKNLLKEKHIMARILKECVMEFKEIELGVILRSAFRDGIHVGSYPIDVNVFSSELSSNDTESSSLTDGNIYFDIRFLATVPNSEEKLELIINVEAQNNTNPGYSLLTRAVYYCSRLISDQKNSIFTNSDYGKIKKVYSIWLCLDPPKKHMNSITEYSFRENSVKGNATCEKKYFDLICIVMVYLGQGQRDDYSDIIGLLSALLSNELEESEKRTVLEKKYNIPMTQALEKEVSKMCNLSKGVEEKTILENIKNLLEGTAMTLTEIMNVLKIPIEQQESIEEKLKNK
jgi:hypothetical protein